MSIVFEQINGWDDFDFDDFFDQSSSRLDLNFFSVANQVSDDDKKQYYKDQIQSAFDGTWPLKQEGETLFLYKGTYDGVVMEFCGGYIENDGITFRGHWYLTAPDDTGSRNRIHTDEAAVSRKNFYEQHGMTQYKVTTYVGSSFHQWMNIRINGGAVTLISQTETSLGEKTFITLVIGV